MCVCVCHSVCVFAPACVCVNECVCEWCVHVSLCAGSPVPQPCHIELWCVCVCTRVSASCVCVTLCVCVSLCVCVFTCLHVRASSVRESSVCRLLKVWLVGLILIGEGGWRGIPFFFFFFFPCCCCYF